jgi:Fe-Mn family superoxide dismutase
MTTPVVLNRRQFVQLGALAAGSALFSGRANAAEPVFAALPQLRYAYGDLEPVIDARTMEIHHSKHHASYVAGLNAAMVGLPELKERPLSETLAKLPEVADESLRTALRNHGGGHWNHAFFWESMMPAKNVEPPSDALTQAVVSSFGSMADFKKAFEAAAMGRFGSGWAWLVFSGGKLRITSTPNQDNPLMKGIVPDADLGTPLLGLDVWEHAYYLHYQNRRAEYASMWWNVVNWMEVSRRFDLAKLHASQ